MIDVTHHAVAQYVVARSRILAAIIPEEILIHPAQVISIDDERMVVKDEVVAIEAAANLTMQRKTADVLPGATRTME
jgi:hypothetical protein